MRNYQHSGIVPVSGAVMTLAAGCLAGMLLGVIYTFSFYYIPFVYLNILLACAFGGGVGLAVGYSAREGKIRNVPVVGALAVVAAFVGIYAEWGATNYAMSPLADLGAHWKADGLLTFLPQNVVAVMLALFQEGSWGMTAGSTVHGWPLVALWVIEAGVIITAAVTVATQRIAKLPFCETCSEWVAGREPHLYTGNGYAAVWSDIQHGAFENLALTPRATGSETHYVRLTLSACPQCDESNFLTITACENKVNAKGHRYLAERSIATNVPLTATQLEIVEAANLIAPGVGCSLPLPVAPPGDWTNPQRFADTPAEVAQLTEH